MKDINPTLITDKMSLDTLIATGPTLLVFRTQRDAICSAGINKLRENGDDNPFTNYLTSNDIKLAYVDSDNELMGWLLRKYNVTETPSSVFLKEGSSQKMPNLSDNGYNNPEQLPGKIIEWLEGCV